MKSNLLQSKLIYLILFLIVSISTAVHAYDNIAAKYCVSMDYQYSIEPNKHGDEVGVCILPDNSKVDAWQFYKGKIGKKFSYCAKNNYAMKTQTLNKNGYSVDVPMCESTSKQGNTESTSMLEMMKSHNDIHLKEKKIPLKTSSTKEATLVKTPTLVKETIAIPQKLSSRKTVEQPDALDWRNYNGHAYIGAVRDQGECGACYAFGAAAAAEGSYNLLNGTYDDNTIDFSEDYIVWCLGTYGPYSDHFDGCGGADYDYQELEALTVEGVTYEVNYPYTGDDPGSCEHADDPTVVFNSWGRVSSNDTDGIQDAIATYGVIDVAVNVTADFENYSEGIFSDTQTDCPDNAYTTVNHAVALVGWGTDDVEGLYWILRNSWGSSWGEDGYMKIKATSARVACAPTYLEANVADSDQCQYELTPNSQTFTVQGGSDTIEVASSPDGCTKGSWSATESLDWVSLTGTVDGTGSGTWSVPYTVTSNVGAIRSGEISISSKVFKIDQDGTEAVTYYDKDTQLMWQDQEYTQAELDAYDANTEESKVLYWGNALNYCENLVLESYSDWHLPTQSELLGIVDTSNTPTIQTGFQNSVELLYWTSTEHDIDNARLVDFSDGHLKYWSKDYSTYIRCVRPHKESMSPAIIMYLLN